MKKSVSLLLVLLLAISLFGCGQAPEVPQDSENIQVNESIQTEQTYPTIEETTPLGDLLFQEIEAEAALLTEAIRNHPDEIVVTGTSYYVSNDGNDHNNGRSPETAWATLKKVSSANLRPGDGVFFNRGDIFRGNLDCKPGVTYAAYGDGDKPILTSSVEDGASPDYWEFYANTEDGGTVWVYHREMLDCGGIFFNHGERTGIKLYPYWNGTAFTTAEGEPFDLLKEMTTDLHFFTPAESKLRNELPLSLAFDRTLDGSTGKLYLRCDAGNPGELFDSIEFGTSIHAGSAIVNVRQECVVDNLCVRYGGDCGFFTEFPRDYTGTGAVVQYCDIGYVGGNVWQYHTDGKPQPAGDCFATSAGFTVDHCYIHNAAYSNGITIEAGGDGNGFPIENMIIRNNVFSHNTGGIHMIYFSDMRTEGAIFRNFLIEDNYIIHTGKNWAFPQLCSLYPVDPDVPFILHGQGIRIGDLNDPNDPNSRMLAENIVIRSNVFHSDYICNVWGAVFDSDAVWFENNTIFTKEGIPAAIWSTRMGELFGWYYQVPTEPHHKDAQYLFNQHMGSGNTFFSIS